ncbi:MAG TPA: sensor histidine kinase KdpD [Caproicibacter sp.]|nr:sensor histidine kinase KdpD [Caproicibacter sp.]
MAESRPNPDELLAKIRQKEVKNKKGKLKIFFGYAAGVGKTYAMLDAAHSAKKLGMDVVAGYVEPHQRPDTTALLEGLEALQPLKVDYKGIFLNEFDIDAALARKPQLILVDELAHTNAVECRNTKRYMDVEELLRAGIDVYTTVNVQHLESLNDIVASITQVVVKERIPDYIFDHADQVELVDIEPDDLISRLNEGKIYKQTQAQKALGNFFIRENLVALREIALRRTADRVNKAAEQSRLPTQNSDFYAGEHILICLSSSPSNAKVIRTAARMAYAFHAAFTALFVETPNTKELNDENRSRLRKNLKLAEQLGAKIATVYGEDIPYQISEYAKVSGVTKIVMGRSNNKAGLFRPKNNLIDRIATLAPNVDVHIIPDTVQTYGQKFSNKPKLTGISPKDLLKMLAILTLCTLAGLLFEKLGLTQSSIITIYILGVLVISSQTIGRFYGILSSVVGVLAYNFFFIDPKYTFTAYGAEYPITFLVMLVASLITSTLTMKEKNQARKTAMQAHRTEVLLDTSRKLQRAKNISDIVSVSSQQLLKLLDKPFALYIVQDGKLGEPLSFYPPRDIKWNDICTDADEQAVAAWVFKNRKPAGVGTETLPGSKAFYLPIRNHDTVFAVIGIIMKSDESYDPFVRSLLSAMLDEIAFAIEKYKLNEAQKQATMESEKERLRANLLRAISHDLRTPLTSISGNASVLLTNENQIEPNAKRKLYQDIYDDSMWLINLVENLLSVTRIDNGTMSIKMQAELVDEIISEAMKHINRKASEHKLSVNISDDMLMVCADARLIIQVIINIIDNAVQYTAPGSEICVRAFRKDNMAVIEIADNGDGIDDESKKKIFDMFYTANNSRGDSRRGLGLGLSLCKSIVSAHGGEIYVKDNQPKGSIFGFTLQIREVKGNE